MPTERYHVRVTKDSFIFSCAHFITFNRDQGERLHGHNYRVAVEVEGPLDENHYVFDFIALRDRTQAISFELDHHVLLATLNPLLSVEETADRVRVTFGQKEWLFPREDCILLPIENTTAELLAKWIAGRLLADVRGRGFSPQVIRVEVEENIGQSAIYESRA
ncbi:6-pyruvoyl trahydropterin synthase family protein [Limnoglobus roseus]|uniref:6-carboxy-5,6,7,8-tetrahydropterin synthase n=1 Tax=Limnoglobus roseus TaxID=2598579 RepID=A0A5C1A9H0_9BACT|nr:6-pyruvoyl tetrahydropterin synthase family protein [Limnoglobus roseus]QEL15841.1 6-carboxytetrahydropterin synthase [Limnoglobus roseus]